MALDSSGNIAVDFAWGNFPLQPNTERATDLTPVTAAVLMATNSGEDQAYLLNLALAPDAFVVGAKISASGFVNDALNLTDVTIKQVTTITGTPAIVVDSPYITYEGMMSPPQPMVLTLDPAGNTGGGAGDYGWSKTSKKPSVQLDPTLDGHNITTEFWNNFPGYTPNAGFVPQQLWEGTISAYGLAVWYDSPDSEDGYTLQISSPYLSAKDAEAFETAFNNYSFIGASIGSLTYSDGKVTTTLPAGHVVGADFVPDSYGNLSGQLRVAANTTGISVAGVNSAPVNLLIGAAAPKTKVLEAIIGTNCSQVTVNFEPYGSAGYINIYGASPELVAASANAADGYVGFNRLTDPMTGWMAGYNSKLETTTGATQTIDGYGNPILRISTPAQWNVFGYDVADFTPGDSIVVIK